MAFKNKFNHNYLAFVIVVILAIGFSAGFLIGKAQVPSINEVEGVTNKEKGKQADVDFSVFWDTWKTIEEKFVDKDALDKEMMVFGAAQGLVKSLDDPHSEFLIPKDSKRFKEDVSGSFEGVGMEISIRGEILTVVSPLKGTPAQKAGIKAGDKIVEIDGESTRDITLDEAVNAIRGPKGTEVVLTIVRDGLKETKEISIVRGTIEIPIIEWELKEGNVAHIKLFHFSGNASRKFAQVANELLNSEADRIILDLRNNPGGFLEVSVDIAGWFLKQGSLVVTEKFGDGREVPYNSGNQDGLFINWPIVVLVNEGSASASEILAGALRDHREIQLVGQNTFGKGSVQQLENLKQGASLKLTVAKWLTPDGFSINDKGLTVDAEVENNSEDNENVQEDPQLEKALKIIQLEN